MDIVVHPPSDDPSKGFEGQASSTVGRITRHEFHRTPLAEIVRVLGKMPVGPRIERTIPSLRSEIIRVLWKEPMETPEQKLAKQRYSVRIAYSHSLTSTERVQRLGQRFGFVAEVEARHGTRTRWIFTQDGSEFPTTPPEGNVWSSGKRYRCTGYPLGFAIPGMLENAAFNDLVKGYDQDLDAIEMQWDDAAADNPFERPVDIEVDFSDGWDVALDYLREHFGVKMERISEPITYEVLVLRPHGKGAK